jgi:hypothetical protein
MAKHMKYNAFIMCADPAKSAEGWPERKNPQADWADFAQLIGKIGA